MLLGLLMWQGPQTGIEWLTRLQGLEARARKGSAVAGVEADVRQLRRELEAAGMTGLPAAAPGGDAEKLRGEIAALRALVEERERQRVGSAFQLARMEVNVNANVDQLSTTTTLEEEEYRRRDLRTIPDALNLTPGVSIQRIGPRNERGVFIRGFDVRQAPLYIDGIPVYVPYDGYVDMDRFLTYDVGEIEVAKGYTSPLYGPNALGGAINLITKAPAQPHSLDLGAGFGAGGQVNGFANTGVKWKQFWGQGGFAWLSSENFPLPGGFRSVPLQPAGGRANAYQTDYQGRVRLGWTPNARDQYTFTYANQKGQKGNPPYAGTDPIVRPRFWQWPTWDKESFYFVGNKSLGETSYVRLRGYYDKFDNILRAYDNNCYCTQRQPNAFTSPFDDDTYGVSTEFGTRVGERQTVKGSFFYKDDTHREGNVGEPTRSYRDQTYSLGLEDTIRLSRRASVIVGLGVDRLQVLNAENFLRGQVLPHPKREVTAFNPQAAFFYTLRENTKLNFTAARKTRMPTIKDRYSYRLGQAIPNPDLLEERTRRWAVGLTHLLGRRGFRERRWG